MLVSTFLATQAAACTIGGVAQDPGHAEHAHPAMTVQVLQLFSELGIPSNYGVDPPLPTHAETELLVDVEPNIVGRMQRLHPDTASAWEAMKSAARQDGISLLLVSGFRSFGYQIELIRAKLEAGQDIASILTVNTAPGFSEHHTGRAVDLATPGTRPLTDQFERSDAFFWLQHNAQRFDFHMPYGRGNRYGLNYEPWHWSQLGGADQTDSTPATV